MNIENSTSFLKGVSLAITKDISTEKKAEGQKTYGLVNGKVVVTTNVQANAKLRQKVWEAAQAITDSKRNGSNANFEVAMANIRLMLGISADGKVNKGKSLIDRKIFNRIVFDIKQSSGIDLAADKTKDSFSISDEFALANEDVESEVKDAKEGQKKEVDEAIKTAVDKETLTLKAATLVDFGRNEFQFMPASVPWSEFASVIRSKLEEKQKQFLGEMLNNRVGSVTVDKAMWKKAEELATESLMPQIHNCLISLDLLRKECVDAGISQELFVGFVNKLVNDDDAGTLQKMLGHEKSSDRRKLLETAMEKLDPESKKLYDAHAAKLDTQRARAAAYRLERFARQMTDDILSLYKFQAESIAKKKSEGKDTTQEEAAYKLNQEKYGKTKLEIWRYFRKEMAKDEMFTDFNTKSVNTEEIQKIANQAKARVLGKINGFRTDLKGKLNKEKLPFSSSDNIEYSSHSIYEDFVRTMKKKLFADHITINGENLGNDWGKEPDADVDKKTIAEIRKSDPAPGSLAVLAKLCTLVPRDVKNFDILRFFVTSMTGLASPTSMVLNGIDDDFGLGNPIELNASVLAKKKHFLRVGEYGDQHEVKYDFTKTDDGIDVVVKSPMGFLFSFDTFALGTDSHMQPRLNCEVRIRIPLEKQGDVPLDDAGQPIINQDTLPENISVEASIRELEADEID